jgi:hypothetical protein
MDKIILSQARINAALKNSQDKDLSIKNNINGNQEISHR